MIFFSSLLATSAKDGQWCLLRGDFTVMGGEEGAISKALRDLYLARGVEDRPSQVKARMVIADADYGANKAPWDVRSWAAEDFKKVVEVSWLQSPVRVNMLCRLSTIA